MAIIDRNIGKCVVCGQSFDRKRISKTTCSDRCRKTLSRKKQADSVLIAYQLRSIHQSISIIKDMLKNDEYSHQAAIALEGIRVLANSAIPNKASMWHCETCTAIRIMRVPSAFECACGETAVWVLQKIII